MVELRHKSFGNSAPQEKHEEKNVDLQSLIELGCIKDSIKLGNLTFQLRSLNVTERIEVSKVLVDNSSESVFKFNINILSLAIESVDNKPLESFHPNYGQTNDILKLREEIISSLQAPVISKLLEFYNKISERSDSLFDEKQVKNIEKQIKN